MSSLRVRTNCIFYMVRGEAGGLLPLKRPKVFQELNMKDFAAQQRYREGTDSSNWKGEKGSCWAPFTRQRTTMKYFQSWGESKTGESYLVLSPMETQKEVHVQPKIMFPPMLAFDADYMCTDHDQEVSPWLPWFLEAPSTSWAHLLLYPFKKNKLSCINNLENMYEANGLTRVAAWWGSLLSMEFPGFLKQGGM